jgi:hypothetical protein
MAALLHIPNRQLINHIHLAACKPQNLARKPRFCTSMQKGKGESIHNPNQEPPKSFAAHPNMISQKTSVLKQET